MISSIKFYSFMTSLQMGTLLKVWRQYTQVAFHKTFQVNFVLNLFFQLFLVLTSYVYSILFLSQFFKQNVLSCWLVHGFRKYKTLWRQKKLFDLETLVLKHFIFKKIKLSTRIFTVSSLVGHDINFARKKIWYIKSKYFCQQVPVFKTMHPNNTHKHF